MAVIGELVRGEGLGGWRSCHGRELVGAGADARCASGALALESALSCLIVLVVCNPGPRLSPSIRAGDRPQGEEWVHMRARPMHAATFQARLDHQLVGAFHAPAADRKPLSF